MPECNVELKVGLTETTGCFDPHCYHLNYVIQNKINNPLSLCEEIHK